MAEKENDKMSKKEVKRLAKKAKKGKQEFFPAVGRRKRAVARVWLYPEKGEILVNGESINEVYTKMHDKLVWVKPFHAVGVSHPTSRFSATIKVSGGGFTGQLEAIQLGLTRALIKYNEEFKPQLKSYDLTTRDPREVERKKPSRKKARKKEQFSKR